MPEVREPAADAPAVTLAERWADFTKAVAIYPETNRRVRLALDAFLEALAIAYEACDGDAVEILFHQDAICAHGREAPLGSGSNVGWLGERVHKAALAGVAFEPTVDDQALLGFTARLLEIYTSHARDVPFGELWPESYPGLSLVERIFEGEFGEGGIVGGGQARSWGGSGVRRVDISQEERLIRLLAENQRIRDCLDRLSSRLEEASQGEEPSISVDVLGRLVKLVPSDATQEYDDFIDFAARVLDRLSDAIGKEEAVGEDAELNQLLFAVSRGLLARQSRAPERNLEKPAEEEEGAEESTSCAPRGHAGDEGIEDDLQALIAEIATLPRPPADEFIEEHLYGRSETIGVYLHNLVRTTSRDTARRVAVALAGLLESAENEELNVLRQYLVSYWYRADDGSTDLAFERILDFLLQTRQAPLLRREGFLGVEVVVGTFPRYFGLFLDSLDLQNPDHLGELKHVIQGIGAERLGNAADRLLQEERLLEGDRTTRLLDTASPSLLPLARLVLAYGDVEQRRPAVAYLRRLNLEAREATLLYVLENSDDLPATYLTALAAPDADGTYPSAFTSDVGELIRQFVRETVGRTDLLPRRTYAISRLANFPTAETRTLLVKLLRRRLLVIPAEPPLIRQAAREVLTRIGGP